MSNEVENLKQKLAAAEEAQAAAEATAKAATEANDALSKALTEKSAEKKAGALPTVTVEKDKYRITMPSFTFKKVTYTAAQLKADPKLCAELVKLGAGVLEKVSEKE